MLAIAPCSDAQTCNESTDIEMSHSHDHSEDKGHDCTPFCNCQCCGVFYTAPEFKDNSINTIDRLFYSINSNYTINYSYEFLENIWHPPSHS